MNEIDFVRLARLSTTGDVVLCHTAQAPSDESAPSFARDVERAEAVGIVIRFVDPAKPLLLFRTRSANETNGAVTVELDFFQDALYAAEPRIAAHRLSVWRRTDDTDGNADVSPWLRRVETIIRHPLGTDTELFDAYAAGALNATYRDTTPSEDSLTDWLANHMKTLSITPQRLSPWRLDVSIWEGHDVYSFG